jgi:serine protease Do
MLADPGSLRAGHLVLALGAPLGVSQALAVGVVFRVPGARSGSGLIEADLDLAPGNSGGPLADAAGGVVGINTAVAGGLGLAVPGDRVSRLIRWVDRQRLAA